MNYVNASEDGISDMTIKVHIEDEDVYRILITKLKNKSVLLMLKM